MYLSKAVSNKAVFDVNDWTKIGGKQQTVEHKLKDWEQTAEYTVNDFVVYDNNIYRAKENNGNEEFAPNKWQKLTDNAKKGLFAWVSDKQYQEGDIVVHEGDLYRAKAASKEIVFTSSQWDNLTFNSRAIITTWQENVDYVQNQIVVHDGDIYRAKNASNKAAFDADDWERLSSESSFDSIVPWSNSKKYKQKSIVVYENCIYSANENIEPSEFDDSKWTKLVNVRNFAVWDSQKSYKINDMVMYNNDIYVALKNIAPSSFTESDWHKITNRIEPNIKDWKEDFEYSKNDVVVYKNNIYRAKETTNKHEFAVADWDVLTQNGAVKISVWEASKEYQQGEIIKSNVADIFYFVNKPHTSTSINADITNQNLIGLVTVEDFSGRAYAVGEIVRYNKQLYRAKTTVSAKSEFKLNEWDVLNSTIAVQDWKQNTVYPKDTFVVIDDISYQVTSDVTSGESFSSEFSYVKPQYASIAEWKQNAHYQKGVTVIYNEALYQCVVPHTSEATFAKDNWKLVAAFSNTTIIENFDFNKSYRPGEMVYYQNRLYRAPIVIEKSAQFQSQWVCVNAEAYVSNWEENKPYLKDCVVSYLGVLYRAKLNVNTNTFMEDDWERLVENVLLSEWKKSTIYDKGDIVIFNSQIWRSGQRHNSGLEFDASLWESLTGGGGGGSAGWKQVTKLNATSNTVVRINFPETLTFCFPPIDVLQLVPGSSNITLNSYTFDAGDGERFEYDKQLVTFDGNVRCNTSIKINMSEPQAIGSGFICISEEIDLDKYSDINGVSV